MLLREGDKPKRDWLFINNCKIGHVWTLVGGANAGCRDECCCSVPVYRCDRCGDYDYGENAEAVDIRKRCREISDDDATRQEIVL
jgi:hypothetical protein